MLDLIITLENYEEALAVIRSNFCTAQATDVEKKVPSSLGVKKGTPLDIKAKLVVVLIKMGLVHHLEVACIREEFTAVCNDFLQDMPAAVLDTDPEECGDLMLDVAEAYMSQRVYGEALPFLKKLVDSETYSQAAVWLSYGECLMQTGRLERAEKAYRQVVAMAPNHHNARRALSNILSR